MIANISTISRVSDSRLIPNLNEGGNRVNNYLQTLNDASLVIFAPNTRGNRHNDDAARWNSIETPILVIQQVATQSTGLNWINERNYAAYTNDIEIKQANHPFLRVSIYRMEIESVFTLGAHPMRLGLPILATEQCLPRASIIHAQQWLLFGRRGHLSIMAV